MGLWCNKKKLCMLHFIRFAGRQTSQIKKDSWKCQSSYGNHEWPRQDPVEVDQSDPEVRTTVLTNLLTTGTDKVTTLEKNVSSQSRFTRVFVWILQLKQNMMQPVQAKHDTS